MKDCQKKCPNRLEGETLIHEKKFRIYLNVRLKNEEHRVKVNGASLGHGESNRIYCMAF